MLSLRGPPLGRAAARAHDCGVLRTSLRAPFVILVAACGGCLRIPSGASRLLAAAPPRPRGCEFRRMWRCWSRGRGEVCIARRNWPRGRPVSAYVVSCVGFRRCALIQSSENWRLLGLRRTANLRDEPGKAAKLVALESSYVIMIFTIGYEGIDLTRFMSLLSHHDIETVVDVREMPLSRKRGFQNRVENGAPSIRLRIRSPGDAGLSQGHQKSV